MIGKIGKRRAVQAAHRRRRRVRVLTNACGLTSTSRLVDVAADGGGGDVAERRAARRCRRHLRAICRRHSFARRWLEAAAVKGGGAGVVLLAFR